MEMNSNLLESLPQQPTAITLIEIDSNDEMYIFFLHLQNKVRSNSRLPKDPSPVCFVAFVLQREKKMGFSLCKSKLSFELLQFNFSSAIKLRWNWFTLSKLRVRMAF